jgi:hypothetical protein
MTPELFKVIRSRSLTSQKQRLCHHHKNSSQVMLDECVEELERLYAFLDWQDEVDEYDWRAAFEGFKMNEEVRNGKEAEEVQGQ